MALNCETFIRRFESDRRLFFILLKLSPIQFTRESA